MFYLITLISILSYMLMYFVYRFEFVFSNFWLVLKFINIYSYNICLGKIEKYFKAHYSDISITKIYKMFGIFQNILYPLFLMLIIISCRLCEGINHPNVFSYNRNVAYLKYFINNKNQYYCLVYKTYIPNPQLEWKLYEVFVFSVIDFPLRLLLL